MECAYVDYTHTKEISPEITNKKVTKHTHNIKKRIFLMTTHMT